MLARKLTKVESRYSQFERECLCVKWACSRFFLYLTGKEFEVRTDHKPLVQVLTPKYKAPSARIERWLLYLQQFRFSVTHIKGKDNYADILSRIPDDQASEKETLESEIYAYSILKDATPSTLTVRQIANESRQDKTLTLLKEAMETDCWTKFQGTVYKAVKDQLWRHGDIIMKGSRIVIPENLWNHTLQLAHKGHQGIVRTKSRLRDKVWWPQMDRQVEALIQHLPSLSASWIKTKKRTHQKHIDAGQALV